MEIMGSGKPSMPEMGDRVIVRFRGYFADGTEFDGTDMRGAPLEFVLGSGKADVPPVFMETVESMSRGEKRTVRIPARYAYGSYNPDLVESVPLEAIPNSRQLPVGCYIAIGTPRGSERVKVLKVEQGRAYFDHNHELAGKDLTFDIELVDIVLESYVEREKHSEDCECGCHKLEHALEHQSTGARS